MTNLISAIEAYDVFRGFSITFMILMVLSSIAMIILVLIQRGDSNNNINALTGGQDTFFGKHKSRSFDGKLKLATVIVGASMVLFSILFFIFQVLTSQLGS